MVPGTFAPLSAALCLVISTVFMHVQKPMVAYLMLRQFPAITHRHCPSVHVRLRKTTGHTTQDTSTEVVRAEALGIVLGLRGDEDEHGAFGGGLDPGPGNETLVD